MLRFILGRVLATIPVVIVVALVTFFMLRLAPGDPAVLIAGENASPELLAQIRTDLGLDRPVFFQFLIWSGNIISGEFGNSIISGTPVLELITSRIEPTISLALTTITVSVLIAIPLGTLAAARRGTLIDRLVIGISVVGFSVPVFVIGYILVLGLAIEIRWFPVQGFRSLWEGLAPFARHMALPTAALALVYIALIARMTRTSVLEVLNEDHVRTARAKGLSELEVLTRHALRNAAVPIVTIVGISFAILLTGVVVTESVFNLPGVGRLTLDAVMARDYPVIQAVILLTSLVYVLINLLVDLIYAVLDPRIRY